MMSIGEKLKQARLAVNLTQETMAEKVGVSRQTISNWENGKSYPDIASVIILSDVYCVTLDSLLKGDNKMMKHLKDSTDVTKSNKELAVSFILAGVFCAALILVRIFIPIPKITGVIPNIIAVVVFAVGAIIALAGTINIKKLSEQKTSNKTLLKIGAILLYFLIYVPLILVVPQAISSGFRIETEWLQGVVRVTTAIVLLIPSFVIYKKIKYLFTD
jgi:transcriptional regulator with XRE-family HTH domain